MLCVFLCPTHPTEQNTLSALLCHKWPDCLLRVAESQSGMCTRCPFIVPCLWQALRMLPCLVTRAELSHFCYDPCDTDKNTEAWGQHLLRVTRLGRAGAGVQTLPPCAAFTGALGMAACLGPQEPWAARRGTAGGKHVGEPSLHTRGAISPPPCWPFGTAS